MADVKITVPAVYPAIAAVQAEIEPLGISKDKTATTGGSYKYRGVDAVLDSFAGPMARAKLLILPNLISHVMDKVPTRSGEMERSIVKVEFTFLSLIDGSTHPIGAFGGEAVDSLDKSLSKAQSVALRTCYLETFTVPLGPAPDGTPMDPEGGEEEGAQGAGTKTKPATAAPIDTHGEKPARDDGPGTEGATEVVERCTDGQKRILETALKRKALTGKDLKTAGFADVNRNNYNDAMAWVKQQPAPNA